MTLLRCVDLFSGIGGFSLALKHSSRQRVCTVAYCEIDVHCRAVLQANMARGLLDHAPVFEDVTQLTARDLEPLRPELLTAGFPCQDTSCANTRGTGLDGPRSGLVWHVLRLARTLPTVRLVVLENSQCIQRRGLDKLLKRFRRAGFASVWGLFSAQDVGAPHKRRRWVGLFWRMEDPIVSTRLDVMETRHWLREPVPRLIERPTDAGSRHDIVHRLQMLGNSVVPQCIGHAIMCLLSAAKAAVRSTGAHQPLDHQVECPPLATPPELALQFVTPESAITRTRWSTPRRDSWRILHLSSYKPLDHLATQMFHEAKTVDRYGKSGSGMVDRKAWAVNPEFIEWLMGFSRGWTEIPKQLK